jgi:hypothetical protein
MAPEQNAFESLYRIGKELVDEKKEAIMRVNGDETDEVDASQVAGRDLMSALGACLSPDILHRSRFMSRIQSGLTWQLI